MEKDINEMTDEEVQEELNDRKMVVVYTACRQCKSEYKFLVKESQVNRYKKGVEGIQDIFPTLNADERELLISGICRTCFDKLFSDNK